MRLRCFLFCLSAFFSQIIPSALHADAKTLKVAAYELDPYITEKGEEPGYLFEMLEQAFSKAGYRLDIQFYPRLRARSLVESGERDILIPTYLGAKDNSLLYSLPLQGSQISYFKLRNAPKKDNPIVASAVDENVLDDSARSRLRTDKGHTLPIEKTTQLIDMLNLKRIDLAIADRFAVAQILGSHRPHLLGKIQFIEPPLLQKDFYVGFSKKNKSSPKLLKDFNAALLEMQRSREYQKILEKYGNTVYVPDEKTLNILTLKNFDTQIMEEMTQKYLQTRPGVKINWMSLEENHLRRRLVNSIALEDGAFDIWTVGAQDTLFYGKNKWIEPLDNLPKSYDAADFMPIIKQTLSRDGVFYGLPFNGETTMTYYRKDLFAKAKLRMPEKPKYSEILRFAEQLHDPARGLYGICLRGKAGWGANVAYLTTLVNTFGAVWFDEHWQPKINSKPFYDAMNFYVNIVKKFGPPDSYRLGYAEALKEFSNGSCAMWIDATVAASSLNDPRLSKVVDKVGYAFAPVEKTEAGRQWNWSWALAVASTSKKKPLAEDFIQWATSKEYINLVAKEKGWATAPPGTRLSTYNSEYKKAAPFASFIQKVMQDYVPLRTNYPKLGYPGYVFVEIPEFSAVGTSLSNQMADVLKGKVTLGQALQTSQQEIRNIMYHAGYYRTPN